MVTRFFDFTARGAVGVFFEYLRIGSSPRVLDRSLPNSAYIYYGPMRIA